MLIHKLLFGALAAGIALLIPYDRALPQSSAVPPVRRPPPLLNSDHAERLRLWSERNETLPRSVELDGRGASRYRIEDPGGGMVETSMPAAAVASAGSWDTRFGHLGLGYGYAGGRVIAVAEGPGNKLYVGGEYLTRATNDGVNTPVRGIACWDGSSWSSMDGGLNPDEPNGGFVRAIEVYGEDVYVGGAFHTAGTVAASCIAKWDGTGWTALGAGVGWGFVNAIAVIGDQVYAGGSFMSAGGDADISYLACWKWGGWWPVGTGVDGEVTALEVIDGVLYVGGGFAHAGGEEAGGFAAWDGVQWIPKEPISIGSPGFSVGRIYDIEPLGAGYVIGGAFDYVGYLSALNVAWWDGNHWTSLGSGVSFYGSGGIVTSLAKHAGKLYASGGFNLAGGVAAFGVARWDTVWSAWDSVGYGVNGGARALAVVGEELIAGGDFSVAGRIGADHIAKWDLTEESWEPVGTGGSNGADDGINAVAASGGDVFAGGWFYGAGGVDLAHVGSWSDTAQAWAPLGRGVWSGSSSYDTPVFAIAADGDDVYVGGGFAVAGSLPVWGIARWNRTEGAWDSLGAGLYSTGATYAVSIAVDGDDVYVGGAFAGAGWEAAPNIARWSKSTESWHALGTGVNGSVYAVAAAGGKVYAGGDFSIAGGQAAEKIAVCDVATGTWSALGEGIRGGIYIPVVNHIEVRGAEVYVGGRFDSAGTARVMNVAKWDTLTKTWSAVGGGTGKSGDHVLDLKFSGDGLYAGGVFDTIGGTPARNVARWDPGSGTWEAVGPGVDGEVASLDVVDGDLFVGGYFTEAGGVASKNFAVYRAGPGTAVDSPPGLPGEFGLGQNYPNPFNPSTTIRFDVPATGWVSLRVFDILGREAAVLRDGIESPGRKEVVWDAVNAAAGVYFLRLDAGGLRETRTMVLMK